MSTSSKRGPSARLNESLKSFHRDFGALSELEKYGFDPEFCATGELREVKFSIRYVSPPSSLAVPGADLASI